MLWLYGLTNGEWEDCDFQNLPTIFSLVDLNADTGFTRPRTETIVPRAGRWAVNNDDYSSYTATYINTVTMKDLSSIGIEMKDWTHKVMSLRMPTERFSSRQIPLCGSIVCCYCTVLYTLFCFVIQICSSCFTKYSTFLDHNNCNRAHCQILIC